MNVIGAAVGRGQRSQTVEVMWLPAKPISEDQFERAVAVLASLRFDPSARRSFEVFSGAFCWSDETGVSLQDKAVAHVVLQDLIVFRASLALDKPDESRRAIWERVQARCPDWPGFRVERRAALTDEEAADQRRMTDEVIEVLRASAGKSPK
jgi:hypothetical protein